MGRKAIMRKGPMTAAERKRRQRRNERVRVRVSRDEWLTPSRYVGMAREVLGAIDLDPATCADAQEYIRAARFYTKDHDGLAHPWRGRTWCNPPFSRTGEFVNKLVDEFEAGHVTAAVLLTHGNTDPEWFHLASAKASAVCFTKGRIRFERVDRSNESPPRGQVLFYFGADPLWFRGVFDEIGTVFVTAACHEIEERATA
jgi:ParB family chromosome partitioning protein